MTAQATIRGRTAWRPWLLVAAILVAAATAAVLPGTAQPAFPGANGKIAYASMEAGRAWIHVVNPDGSSDTQLTDTGHDYYPAWSPDGGRIAFTSDRDGNTEIYVMNADGSGQTRLTNDLATDATPAWSPDGRKIAFTSDRDGDTEIYVMNADGTGQTRLTNAVGHDLTPAWSPDGQKIAFTSIRGFVSEISVMNADGSGLTRLTSGAFDFQPEWSPDGGKIAFAGVRDAADPGSVYVVDTDGTGLTRLTGTMSPAADPAWSPDGQRIALLDADGQISVVNADGSGAATRVTTAGVNGSASWQPLVTAPVGTASVQPPVNADGSSVFKAGKGVVPVKFTLTLDGVPTCTLPPATITLTRLSEAGAGAVNEPPYTMPADEGSSFRVDDCQYVYNLSLKSLTAGTYRVTIVVDGRPAGDASFELR